jgi:hypothetical protein
VVNATPRPIYTRERDKLSLVQKAVRALDTVWTGVRNLASNGIRHPGIPARSESLYLLRHPGPQLVAKSFTELREWKKLSTNATLEKVSSVTAGKCWSVCSNLQ